MQRNSFFDIDTWSWYRSFLHSLALSFILPEAAINQATFTFSFTAVHIKMREQIRNVLEKLNVLVGPSPPPAPPEVPVPPPPPAVSEPSQEVLRGLQRENLHLRKSLKKWEKIGQYAIDSSIFDSVSSMLSPEASAHEFTRIGSPRDGGYVIATDIPQGWVLSLGVGSDNCADVHLAESGLPVFEFDHTVEGPPASHKNILFQPKGLGSTAQDPLFPLDHLMDLCHPRQGEGLLMIDVEGAEWEMLAQQAPGSASRVLDAFGQICIELHGLEELLDPHANLLEGLSNLVAHHVPLVSHVNNYGPCLPVSGSMLPTVLELTLVRSDLFQAGSGHVPDHLLSPNDPEGPRVQGLPFSRW